MPMNAIAMLIGDHNRVRGLFARFETAKEAKDDATMAELAELIFEQLDVHTTIEETVFYPSVKEKSEEIAETVAEGFEEHKVVKRLISECQAVETGGEEWIAKMTVIVESVEHHAGEEEEEMFPKVRTALGADGLKKLAAALTAKKKELGAPTAELVIDLTKAELMEKAQAQEIPGRSSMDHDELALTVDPRF